MAGEQKKTRAEREIELGRLWKTSLGRAQVMGLYAKVMGEPRGTMPTSPSLILKTILDKEFPNAGRCEV